MHVLPAASRKPPLVLIPGLICDEALWRPQTEALPDVCSPSVADLTTGSSIDALADAVLAQAPARFALAGLSMGGYVAQAVVRRSPERVTHLALLDTSARPDTAEQQAARESLIDLAERGRFREITELLLARLIAPERLADTALVETVLAMERRFTAEVFIRQERAIIGRPDNRKRLGEIAAPTLVLCGEQDAITPPRVHAELRDAIPHAQLVVVPACGHLATLERPAAVNAALRCWLARPGVT